MGIHNPGKKEGLIFVTDENDYILRYNHNTFVVPKNLLKINSLRKGDKIDFIIYIDGMDLIFGQGNSEDDALINLLETMLIFAQKHNLTNFRDIQKYKLGETIVGTKSAILNITKPGNS